MHGLVGLGRVRQLKIQLEMSSQLHCECGQRRQKSILAIRCAAWLSLSGAVHCKTMQNVCIDAFVRTFIINSQCRCSLCVRWSVCVCVSAVSFGAVCALSLS